MGKPQRSIFNLPKSGTIGYVGGMLTDVTSGGGLGGGGGGLGGGGLGGGGSGLGSGPLVKPSYNKLTAQQINALQLIYDSYTVLLADKQYEKISTQNYVQYMEIMALIKTVNIQDPNLKLMISIAENMMVGTVNFGTLYTSYVYNEIKVALLNKRINEILTNKNVHNTATGVTGQFTATQVFTLSPLYSYYIYVYGMPEFGVGFDPAKLAFIKSLPQFSVLGQSDMTLTV